MSTIKSSAEHLTLNADGSGKDIKFQANGVEKASISSSGAFTSTTIDATKLTGTIPNFTSTGIDDNATSTAMTITSDGRGLSQFTAKAWCNFDGTGTAAIRDSHNVSSLTDNGTGDFTINFSNNMGNTNYSTSIGNYRSTGDTGIGGSNIVSITVGSIRFETVRDASTKMNPNFCNFLVFGD